MNTFICGLLVTWCALGAMTMAIFGNAIFKWVADNSDDIPHAIPKIIVLLGPLAWLMFVCSTVYQFAKQLGSIKPLKKFKKHLLLGEYKIKQDTPLYLYGICFNKVFFVGLASFGEKGDA